MSRRGRVGLVLLTAVLLTQCTLFTSLSGLTSGDSTSDAAADSDASSAPDTSIMPVDCTPRLALLAATSAGAFCGATYDAGWRSQTVRAANSTAVAGVPAILAIGGGAFRAVLPIGDNGIAAYGYDLEWLENDAARGWTAPAKVLNSPSAGANSMDDVLSLASFDGATILTYLGHYFVTGALEPSAGYREHDFVGGGWSLGHSPDLTDNLAGGSLPYAPSVASKGSSLFTVMGKVSGSSEGGPVQVSPAFQSRTSLADPWTPDPPLLLANEKLRAPPRIVGMRKGADTYLAVFKVESGLLMSTAYDATKDAWTAPVFVGGPPGFATADVPALVALADGTAVVAARDASGVAGYSVFTPTTNSWSVTTALDATPAVSPVALASSECGGAVAAYAVAGGTLGVRVTPLLGAAWGGGSGTGPTPVPGIPATVTSVALAAAR